MNTSTGVFEPSSCEQNIWTVLERAHLKLTPQTGTSVQAGVRKGIRQQPRRKHNGELHSKQWTPKDAL